ncbi:FAS1-like dehydratase domain-containing protein [Nocardioides panaciterrulae]|uniref:3-methylfumaryl-CoA hydratase n=1 Tax=Nocardioides panaciterrulae TaxID=661492 RepID=A0A7Y9JAY6_9ACTN|nr:MaoC family dehydratase N-terminal domain-containing protein [Nocardioides panaciterrulae]NYD41843.1 3-methylfumaryl-CoA hydratase [Nocardioides panaciterrulae]
MVERTELLAPEPAIALAGLLDVPLPDLGAGDGLPLTWHWVYLLERPLQRDLGPDGHPVRNAVPEPPGPGLRRMWAGGAVRSLAPLRVGEQTTRRSRVLTTTEKQGRTGRLTFVTVGHSILQRGETVIEERQDILYRDLSRGPSRDGETGSTGGSRDAAPGAVVEPGPGEWSVPVSPTLLFRFSALTYNGHRIHYDREYARDQEGYPGLVVHGPLQAMAMAEAARARGVRTRPGVALEYRLVAPLFDDQGLIAGVADEGEELATSVRDAWGRRTAQGRMKRPSAD